MPNMNKREDLEKRIKDYALQVIALLRKLPKTEENRIFTHQIIRSVTSIGANYAEAQYAHTRLEFLHTLNICRKEANETFYWLQLFAATNLVFKAELNMLLDEGQQILKIFITGVKTAKSNTPSSKS